MNHIYRLCWNRATSQWVAASELARSAGPSGRARDINRSRRSGLALSALTLSLAMAGIAHAGTTGGQVTAGVGTITHSGNTTTIVQNSQQLSLNWQSFDVGSSETVNFVQPGKSSVAINRVLGNTASEIFGNLNANGQVWLINPNGVLFGKGSQVNVGGLVATTLDTGDTTNSSGARTFSGNGKGSVVNQGSINAGSGGYVALLGNQVSNQGTITARLGTVALGAGSAVTLTFQGNQLLHVQVDQSTLNNLVENKQLIQADGGQVIMTAGAANAILASTVNNTGIVRAQTVENHNGTITLLGGMEAGEVNVGGTLDASAPNGGNGGQIETSAAYAHIAGDANITASAPGGKAGTWLVDPFDLTIDTAAATSIQNTLNIGTNVTEQTFAAAAPSGSGVSTTGTGNINVNAPISWTNAASTLTLLAFKGINVNSVINGAGSVVMTASNANITIGAGASITGSKGVTLSTAANFVNQSGAAAVAAGAGARWLVYSTNPTADTRGGLTAAFTQYNATAGATPLGTGNGFLYKVAPVVSVTGLSGTAEKDYDGTNVATIAGGIASTGLINGDSIATAAGTYGSTDVGTGLAVTSSLTAAGYTFTDAGGHPVFGYQVGGTPVTANIGVIDPKKLTISIVGTPTKTYDGTSTATLGSSNYVVGGLVGSQVISFSQPNSVSYAAPDAGAETVTANFVPSNFVASNGAKFSNYVLPTTGFGAGFINQATVNLTGLLTNDKVYDGTTTDPLDSSHAGIFGVISSDTGAVTLDKSAGTGLFGSVNVGNNLGVTASGFVLTGSQAHNYLLVGPTDLTASITPKSLSIGGIIANNKVYDATNVASLNLANVTLNGLVSADQGAISLSTSGQSATFGTVNVGNGIGVTANGFSLTGTGLGNYTLSQPTGLSANITPALLNISITGNPARTYNGTTTANLGPGDVTVTGLKGSDSVTINQSAGASYASPNASTNDLVTANLQPSDFTLGGGTLLSNYTYSSTISGNGTITPIQLIYSLVGNPTKTFDGTTAATLNASNFQLSGFLAGQGATVNQTAGTYDNPNAGQRGVTANLTAANFNPFGGTILSNYVLPTIVAGLGTIVPAPIQGTIYAAINGPTKVYDGTTVAILGPSNYVLTGFMTGDGATVDQTVGAYGSKNVGIQSVTALLTDANFSPTGSTVLSNYTLPSMAFGTGEITPKQLTASIVGNPTKVYNGTTYVTLVPSNYQLFGLVAGENADIVPSSEINFATKNVGTQLITAAMATSSFLPASGTLLSNYLLPTQATGNGTITKAPLFVIGVSAQNKSYDTTIGALLNSAGSSLVGIAAGDEGNVNLTRGTTGTFSQANVGNGLAVTPIGFGITGSEINNYALQPITGLTANITPAHLSISGVTAQDKIYDGSTVATLNDGAALLNGIFASDAAAVDLNTAGATGSTRSANVGSDLAVTTTGFTLGGAQSGNYVLDQLNGLTMDITPRALTATITGNPSKPYDGSNSVTLTAADYTLGGFVAGQGASVPQSATAQYDSSNAGTHIGLQSTLVVSDFVANAGTNLANYILPVAATGTLGVITPFILNLQSQRVYDATTNADFSLFAPAGTIAGVNGETLTLTGSGVLTNKNVGSQRAFANTGTLTLGDNASALASNYTLVGGTDWVTITPAMLSVSGTVASNKVYDANRNAALSGSVLNGVLGSDTVNLLNTAVGLFDTKNVGNGKTVTTAMTVNGTDAGNYILVQPTNVKANITALGITVNANGVNRVYNGTTSSGATLSSAGVFSGDTVTFTNTSNTFDTKNVGNGKIVSVTGIGKTGTDAGNYILLNSAATTTANITPFVINLQGTRVYDADTDAAATLFGTNGVVNGVAGESLTVSGKGVLGNKNVGTQKSFSTSLGNLALAGNGSALSSNYTLIGGTDWVTVTKANLTVSGTTTTNKVYDGNTSDVLSGSMLNGVLGTDVVALQNATAGTFDTKNVGTGKTVTTAMTVNGTDAGNYNIIQPTNLKADITALAITVQANGKNKVYDTTDASGATLSSSGVVAGDQVTFTDTSNTFDDKHAGTGKTVTIAGIGSTGADAGNYTLSNSTATTTANITPFVINLTGTRTYDATANANATLFGTGGQIAGLSGESLTLSGVGLVGSKNVSTNQKFANGNPGSLGTLALVGNGSTTASDYTLTGGLDTLTITPFNVTVAANGSNKIYDGNATAGVTLVPTGLFGGDVVNFTDSAAKYSDKNVANGKTITVTGITAGGADAGNYTFNSTATTSGNITPLAITGSILAGNKIYDALTGAVTNGTLSGFVAGDQLTFNTSGTFSDKNVANGKTVNVAGSLGGVDAGNYTLTSNTTTTANITPLTINVTATGPNKVYDGTAAETAMLASAGVIVGDTVDFTDGSVAFSDKNVGNGKTVTVNGITATGTDAGNYVYNTTTTTLANITPLQIMGSIVAGNKVYDGSANATTSGTLAGVIGGDQLTFGTSGTFSDKNAADGKTVNVTGTLGGTDAGNYTLVDNTTTTADITPLAILVSATAPNKIYDGSIDETATLASTGVLVGDSVNFGDTSVAFSDKNVGNGKTVTVNGITANGTDAGNYSYNTTATTLANITPLAITGAIVANDKTYDGSTAAATSGNLTGVIAGDQLGFSTSGVFVDKNAGTGKTVDVIGALTGNDAGNYVFTSNATTTATINQVVLDLTGTRVYNGTAGADAGIFGNAGVIAGIAGETLTLSGSGLLSSKNVASNEALANQGSLALTGNGGASAGNYTLVGGRDTVTVTPLTVDASIVANDKVYDGNNSATTDGTLTGVLAGDDLSLATRGHFVDKNAGNGKTVNVDGTLGGADAENYLFVGNTTTTANITPLGIVVNATGTNRYFDGSVTDVVSLRGLGVLSGDSIVFGDRSATFADAAAGNGKTVTVQGISASGADAGNYTFDTTVLTQADILPLGTQDAPTIAAAQLGSLLQPMRIATPFGTAASNTVGDYSGNHKQTRQPIEANTQRADFYPGLALRVEDGGVKRPADAMN